MNRAPLLAVATLMSDPVTKFAGERPFLATADVDHRGIVRPQRVTYESRPDRANLNVRPGDICMARMQATTKVTLIDDSSADFIVSTGFAVLRPTKIDPLFLVHYLRSARFQRAKDRLCTGATQRAITNEKLAGLDVPDPPLDEQRRIAKVMEIVRSALLDREASLDVLHALPQRVFREMLGTQADSDGWPVTTLGGLCEQVIDCPHSTPTYADAPTPYQCVRSADIQDDELDLSAAKYVSEPEYQLRVVRGTPQPGDVLYCREGARFGNAARVLGHAAICLGQRMMLFRPNERVATSEYIWAYLSSNSAYQQALRAVVGSAAPHVNVGQLVAFPVPMPPPALQEQFSRRIRAIDELRSAAHSSRVVLETLVASIEDRAFDSAPPDQAEPSARELRVPA